MNAPTEDAVARRHLDALLLATGDGVEPSAIAEMIRALLEVLPQTPLWVSPQEARWLLGIDSDATVAAWARLGLVASRPRPDGGIEFLLADVLQRRIERDELVAAGGEELTPEELRVLREERSGANPWERESTNGARAGW